MVQRHRKGKIVRLSGPSISQRSLGRYRTSSISSPFEQPKWPSVVQNSRCRSSRVRRVFSRRLMEVAFGRGTTSANGPAAGSVEPAARFVTARR